MLDVRYISKCLRIFSTEEWTENVGFVQTLQEMRNLQKKKKTEMIRKFCLDKECSSVKSELRTPKGDSEKQPRVNIQAYSSHLIITLTLNSEWDAP